MNAEAQRRGDFCAFLKCARQNLFEIDSSKISNTEVDLTYLRETLVLKGRFLNDRKRRAFLK